MNELTDANFLGSKIKRHLLLKKSSYWWGRTVIRNKQQVFFSAYLLLYYVSYEAGNSYTSEIWWTLKMAVYVEGCKWRPGPQKLTQKFVPLLSLRCEYN